MARKLCKASIISSVFFCFILTTRLCSASESQNNCSSPCGQLKSVLRYKGAPPNCGDPDHELICDGEQTILEFLDHRFYVTDIKYYSEIMHVVAEGLATGNCSLPDQFLLPKYTRNAGSAFRSPWLFYGTWISFLNCSEKIVHDEYWIVPCLSRSNNTYIYATYGTEASIMLPSCSFVAAVPTHLNKYPLNNVFEDLRQGFDISWEIVNHLPVGKCPVFALRDDRWCEKSVTRVRSRKKYAHRRWQWRGQRRRQWLGQRRWYNRRTSKGTPVQPGNHALSFRRKPSKSPSPSSLALI